MAKAVAFFFTLSLGVMKKQKLLDEGNFILFVGITSIKVNIDVNRNQDD